MRNKVHTCAQMRGVSQDRALDLDPQYRDKRRLMPGQLFFESEGSKVAAHLYLPEDANNVPGIVMCHGFAGIKELLLPNFAERFSAHGYAVLTFDYRGFGESGGESGRLLPALQIEDILNAISFMRTCPNVDEKRIALWGTSFGGANAIVAATKDVEICCIAVQLTFGDGERVITNGQSAKEKSNLFALIEKMQVRKAKTGKELMVPIHKVLTDQQSQTFYEGHVAQYPALKVKIPFLTVAETLNHKPEQVVGKIKTPILITAAGKDGVNPVEESKNLFKLANNPKELFIIENATHYELYSGTYFEQAMAKQLEWFDTYMNH